MAPGPSQKLLETNKPCLAQYDKMLGIEIRCRRHLASR